MLYRQNIGRRFHNTKNAAIARGAFTDTANIGLAKGSAGPAVSDTVNRFGQRLRQIHRPGAVALEEMKRHALRRFGADTGQALERIDQLLQ